LKLEFDCLPDKKGDTEMVKQTNNILVREIDKLNENESLAVLDYISELLSSRRFPISSPTATAAAASENHFHDDLIASLAEKRENLRARQVVEWEKVRRRNGGVGTHQRAA
jgi:hypothetical protein